MLFTQKKPKILFCLTTHFEVLTINVSCFNKILFGYSYFNLIQAFSGLNLVMSTFLVGTAIPYRKLKNKNRPFAEFFIKISIFCFMIFIPDFCYTQYFGIVL